MEASDRIVLQLPLEALWDANGGLDAQRGANLGVEQIKGLLRQGRHTRVVLADVGQPLQWIANDRIFGVWKTELANRLFDPAQDKLIVDAMPGDYGYLASLWESAAAGTILLFERYH